jgi:hypothetical protein
MQGPRVSSAIMRSAVPNSPSAAAGGGQSGMNAAARETLQSRYGDTMTFIHSGGGGNARALPSQYAWCHARANEVLARIINNTGALPIAYNDMTFQCVAGSTNLITFLIYEPLLAAYFPLFQCMAECRATGGSLDTNGWVRYWLSLLQQFPILIHDDILRIGAVATDQEVAEINGLCIAVETIIQLRNLPGATMTAADRAEVQASCMRGEFPSPSNPTHARLTAQLLPAGQARCRHMLVLCDFHMIDNFNRLEHHYAPEARLLCANLRHCIDRIRNRSSNSTMSIEDARQLIAEVQAAAPMHPEETQRWLARNFRDDIIVMWAGSLRINLYAQFRDAVHARCDANPDDRELAAFFEFTRAAVDGCHLPQTTSPLEAYHAQIRRELQIMVGQASQRPAADVVQTLILLAIELIGTRDLALTGCTTARMRTAGRNLAAAQRDADAGDVRAALQRQNPHMLSAAVPHTRRSTGVRGTAPVPRLEPCRAAAAGARRRSDR